MITLDRRQELLGLIDQACQAGARLAQTCEIVGLTARSVQRWQQPEASQGDRRRGGIRREVEPANKLSKAEREAVMQTLNSEEFKDLPPSQIVPRLSDRGQYLASESTMYRLLKAEGQLGHRRLEAVPKKRSKPRALVATKPDQIYCWDITYLPTLVRGEHYYLLAGL
jgi:putative transposase